MSVLTRIKNNQILDSTIYANAKIVPGSIVGSLFNTNLTMTSDVTITGNLTVQGASTYVTIATTNTYVNDPLIVMNNAFAGTNTYDLGFIFNRGSLQNQALIWSELYKEFRLIGTTETGTTYGNVVTSSFANLHVSRAYLEALTSTRIPFVSANKELIDDSNFTWNSAEDILTIKNVQIDGTNNKITTTNSNANLTISPNGTGVVSFDSSRLIDVSDPIDAQDVVTLAYLNTQISSGITNISQDDSDVSVHDNGIDPAEITSNVDGLRVVTYNSNATAFYGNGAVAASTLFIDKQNGNIVVNGRLYVSTSANVQSLYAGALTTRGNTTLNLTTATALNSTPIGNATPSTGVFTTATAGSVSSGFIGNTGTAFTGASLNVTGNVLAASITTSTLSVQSLAIPGNLIAGLSQFAAINATPIGNATPSTGVFTTATAGAVNSPFIGNTGAVFTGASLNVSGNVTASTVLAQLVTADDATVGNLTSGFIGNTGTAFTGASINLSGNVLSTGLSVFGNTRIGSLATPGAEHTIIGNVSVSGAGTEYFNIAGNILAVQGSFGSINSTGLINTTGNISGAVINASTLTAAGNVIGGLAQFAALNATPVGNATASTGAFTTLSASQNFYANASIATTAQGIGAVVIPNGGISVSGAANIAGAITTAGAAQFNNTITVGGISAFTNTTNATDASGGTGALRITGGASIAKDLWVGGNLYAANIYGVTQQVITVKDPLLYLEAANTFPYSYEIGVFSQFVGPDPITGTGNAYQHTGLVRDHLDYTWKFFSNVRAEPTGTVPFDSDTIYDPLRAGNLTLTYTQAATSTTTGSFKTAGGAGIGGTLVAAQLNSTGNVLGQAGTFNALTVNGDITSTGFINTTGNVSASQVSVATINATGFINTAGNISAAVVRSDAVNVTGNVSAATVLAQLVTADDATFGNVISGFIGNTGTAFTGASINVTGNVVAATVLSQLVTADDATFGNVVAGFVGNTGTAFTGASINLSGNVVAATVVGSNVFVNGNVTAQYYFGNAAFMSGLNSYSNVQVQSFLSTYAGNLSASFLNVSGNILGSAATFNLATINGNITLGSALIVGGTSGTSGQYLQSTGTGLQWVTSASQVDKILSGASNVTVTSAYANVAINSTNVASFSSQGLINTAIGAAGPSSGVFTYVIAGNVQSGFIGNAGTAFTGASLNVSGNLLASQVSTGTLNATGLINTTGNISASRINADTLAATGTIWANATTDTSSLTTGALIVNGGTAIGKTLWVGEGAVINSTQSSEDFQVRGKATTSLIYASANQGAVVIGGSNTAPQLGSTLKINGTDSLLLPIGSTAQRPSNTGNIDIAGMIRYNNSINNLEYYTGSGWTTPGAQTTLIVGQQFSGNGVQVAFTLSNTATTTGSIVSINGVVQIPTTAYSVSGTTLTFTEAPAVGDTIDVRILAATSTVTNISDGFSAVDLNTVYANISTGTSSSIVRISVENDGLISIPNGSAIGYNQTAINAPGANLAQLDSFSTAAYSTAKYIIQVKDGANIESAEVLIAQDTANALITTYAVVAPAGVLGTFSCNIVSGSVKVWYTPTISTNANIKVQTTYIV